MLFRDHALHISLIQRGPMATALRHELAPRQHLESLSSNDLAVLMGDGDRDAFAVLVKRHSPKLRRILKVKLKGDVMTVDDIVQMTFLRAERFLSKNRISGMFGAFIFRIAINLVKDYLKDIRTRAHFSIPAFAVNNSPAQSLGETMIDERAPLPDRGLVLQEEMETLYRDIKGLPYIIRITFALRIIDGRSCEEVAKMLHTTVGAVKMNTSRARASLRNLRSEREAKPLLPRLVR